MVNDILYRKIQLSGEPAAATTRNLEDAGLTSDSRQHGTPGTQKDAAPRSSRVLLARNVGGCGDLLQAMPAICSVEGEESKVNHGGVVSQKTKRGSGYRLHHIGA